MTTKLEDLAAPFADEEHRTFTGRGGQEFTYIEDETVMDRLDAVLGLGNWQIFTEPVAVYEGVVKVKLGVKLHDEWTWYEDFGYPNNGTQGDALKEAVSDGIRRVGRMVGVARYLYRKPPQNGSQRRPTPVPAASQRPVAVPSTSTPTADPDPYADLPFEGDEPVPFPPIGSTQPKVNDPCPIHDGEVWRGTPGDLWHGPKGVTPDGYCRPAGQPKKARAR